MEGGPVLKVQSVISYAKILFVPIVRHNLGALAAMIAFFGFSSMVPLIFVLLYTASFLIPGAEVDKFATSALGSIVPIIPAENTILLMTVSRLTQLGTHQGIIGFIGLLWTAVGGFVSFQQALDTIWETRHRRSFVLQYVVSFGMIALLLLFTVLSLILMEIVPVLTHLYVNWLWLGVVSHVSFFVLVLVTCYVSFRFLPTHASPPIYLFIGALFTTIVTYISREVFTFYVHMLGTSASIYGTLSFIMLFLFWVYIVATIVLLGAELAAGLARMHTSNQVT